MSLGQSLLLTRWTYFPTLCKYRWYPFVMIYLGVPSHRRLAKDIVIGWSKVLGP